MVSCVLCLLKKGFLRAEIYNHDHDKTSSTVKSSFHGISISIFQQLNGYQSPVKFKIDPSLTHQTDSSNKENC